MLVEKFGIKGARTVEEDVQAMMAGGGAGFGPPFLFIMLATDWYSISSIANLYGKLPGILKAATSIP
ncbi:MAG: hypothetical protein K9G39_10765 [Chlorobium sp.]|uniref:hypothetical protein n=1 Tax=Chlorobium sp. TaxID=1095 RepID=UPI0025C214D8|nr:hypothetical protein [Chlorobium sp.]MCF8384049.1 hypothetical protein [Chlorobium sp.]